MTRTEFAIKSPRQYYWLLKHNRNLLDKRYPTTNKKLTKENCQKDALNYNRGSDWRKNSGAAYRTAAKNGWLDECCEHMTGGRMKDGHWQNKKNCQKDALLYNSRVDWKNNSATAYNAARINGWLDECCEHMTSLIGKHSRRKVINIDTGKIFESIASAAKYIECSATNVSHTIKNNTKCGGYRWAYCDEDGNIIE